MVFKVKGLEEDMTGWRSKAASSRRLTVTGSHISSGVPPSKPKARNETEKRK